ncbi:Gfo/Idh/MocA family protein [Kribbella shirazensis]|uniref:Putative dehydrogenase n=1 Tax=Kribbella shirazensis TaxID=1105143 RepID=A0A7X5VBZ8_9ACTN|nr:Gfo/Idh/MocA family oxidoreductase [Kribbella shirazensis]NIK58348.1 putative dehydrogenase [Kribbella shirazensis]
MRVAVVGAGGWGEHHARIFVRREDTELCAIVGRTPEKTRRRAEKYGATPYTDLDLMLERERPGLVTVCLPNEDHYDLTLELVRTGVPLLVEKPLVFDLTEADTLLSEAGDTFFAINFNHRYAEPVQRAKALIDAGELGELVFATWRFGGEANHGNSPHANLIETQCHGFDLLEHLVGPISALSAHMTDKTYGAFSTVALALDFENRAVGTMLGSYDSSYAYPDTQRVEINGTRGRLVIHDTVRALTFSKAGDPVEQRWHSTYFDDESRSFAGTFDRHVDAVLRALRAGERPPVHARAGRRALALAHAAIESHATGRTVRSIPWTGPTRS